MQSPVDIRSDKVTQDLQLLNRHLSWKYVPQNCKSLLNTGEGWRVIVEGQDSCLRGGPLQHSYQLTQFHCHWGKCQTTGSEHTVNEKGYAAELHFVHWNVDLYNSAEEATVSPRGLTVIGIFVEVGKPHDELAKITDIIHEIPHKGDELLLVKHIDPASFIPEAHDYWTYEGSLTTPPYHESVTWIVFKRPLVASLEQIESFKRLHSSCPLKEHLNGNSAQQRVESNCRPVHPLNGRVIREAPY